MKKLNKILDLIISIVMYVFLSFSVLAISTMLKQSWIWILFIATYCGLTTDFMEKIQNIVDKKWITYIILAISLVLITILSLLIGMPTGEFIPFKV